MAADVIKLSLSAARARYMLDLLQRIQNDADALKAEVVKINACVDYAANPDDAALVASGYGFANATAAMTFVNKLNTLSADIQTALTNNPLPGLAFGE